MNVSAPFKRTTALAALAALALLPVAGCSASGDPAASSAGTPAPALTSESTPTATDPALGAPEELSADEQFQQLESAYDVRLGVYALDTGTETALTYRADERFAYASTFKAFLAAAVLQQHSLDDLDDLITYTSDDLVSHAPVTEQYVDTGMTMFELADAAVRYSDNTATNLLLDEIGGPNGLTAELRSIGDDVTSVDRYETEMNEAVPGDARDTSTPRAFAGNLREYVLGDRLAADKRELLTEWIIGNTTGDELIRAGAPEDWTVGDRTGAGGYGTRNAIAVLWPPERDPIVMAVMSSRDTQGAEYDDVLIAEATVVALDALAED